MVTELINTIVVDDEPDMRKALVYSLVHSCPQVQLLGSGGSDQKTWSMIEHQHPDLVFWDVIPLYHQQSDFIIQFGDMPPFEVVLMGNDRLEPEEITSTPALDFLTKPIKQHELWRLIRLVQEKRQMHRLLKQVDTLTNLLNSFLHPMLELPTMQGFDLVPVDRICYCQSQNNYTKVTMVDRGNLLVTKSLKDVEQALHPHPFVRIHKQHLINLRYMKSYLKGDGGEVVMHDGTVLSVARNRKNTLREACCRFQH
ncbi:MAG: LytTR family DNA-binding domain-containing protein [Pleurocapsa sp. MO_192.B19]|nr:LytTR family DNA-binding domain-containing protein [Pleurocapsa sp. MO_192.B19]